MSNVAAHPDTLLKSLIKGLFHLISWNHCDILLWS